ncbi:triose-phosphate isomerase [bacterium]|nr:triose-phosphate isomerase [bacterium]
MTVRKILIAGNWKMNWGPGSVAEVDLVRRGADDLSGVELSIHPPAVFACKVAERLAGSAVRLGGQDCHWEPSGARTGDVSAGMWAEVGAAFVIVGHSERRADHGESNAVVAAKAASVQAVGLTPIVCVGETLAERQDGRTLEVIGRQLDESVPDSILNQPLVLAYEPVWAIGSGLTPTPQQIIDVHASMRAALAGRAADLGPGVRLLYGGSVKPSNAAELLALPEVNGALVGGASLKAADFLAIAAAAPM